MKEQEVKEVWVPCKYITESGDTIEFPGYEVSDLGRIRSLNYKRSGKTKVLSLITTKDTSSAILYNVVLWKDRKKHYLSVHRLVLSSFKESDYFKGSVVDHVVARTETDCCNHLNNLRWVTQQQNSSTEHSREIKSKKFINRKDQSKRVKVTFSDGTIKEYPSAKEAGRDLEINPKLVSVKILQLNGYYKKLDIHFEYI